MSQCNRLRRKPWVSEQTCLSYSTIERAVKRGSFPPPLKIGVRAIAWRESDILKWIEQQADLRGDS